MSKIAVLVNDGVEEIECLTTVDFCRRAEIEVTTVSVTGKRLITGSHQIEFKVEEVMDDVDFTQYDGLVIPGGPGTWPMAEIPRVSELVAEFLNGGKLLAAICAAPGVIVSATGLIKDRVACGFPGSTPEGMAKWTENKTETDGNLVTGKGPGAAADFAIAVIRYLKGDEVADQIYASTQM